MILAKPPGMDGILCLSTIPCRLMLFDIWIQVSVLAYLIQYVTDAYCLSCTLLYMPWLTEHYYPEKSYSCLVTDVTSWQSLHSQESCT